MDKQKKILKLVKKKPNMGTAKHVCVKVNNLRKLGYTDLEQWLQDPNNVYVGRRGRIFIHKDGEQKIFHYKDSKWGNPFKVGEYSLDEALKLYREHLETEGLLNEIGELKDKNLGCFCDEKSPCHAKILAELAN